MYLEVTTELDDLHVLSCDLLHWRRFAVAEGVGARRLGQLESLQECSDDADVVTQRH